MFCACIVAGVLLHMVPQLPSQTTQLTTHREPQLAPVSPGMNLRDPTANIFALRYDSYEPRLSHRGGWAVAERCRRPLDVLVFVHTSAIEWQRRATMRDTLFEEAAELRFNWTAVFFAGRRTNNSDLDDWLNLEADIMGDLVVFPIEDGHFNITPKLLGGMRWVADHCPTVKNVLKLDDDVLLEPYEVQAYYKETVTEWPQFLHCHVFPSMLVYRDPDSRFYVPWEILPNERYTGYCSGRSVMMTYSVMRELLMAASHVPAHPTDDAFVFGDLALAVDIGHKDIGWEMEWDPEKTDCIYQGRCLFTHEWTTYGTGMRRRSQWGLLLWRHRLLKGDSLDLSPRLEVAAYREMFLETRRKLSWHAARGNISSRRRRRRRRL